VRRNFYGRCRTLHFTGKTLDAFLLTGGVCFSLRKRMSRRFSPIIKANRANINTHPIANTGIPVYGAGCAVNPKFLRGVNRSPHFMAIMFTYNLTFSLKIRVNRQKNSPLKISETTNIRVSAYSFSVKHFGAACHFIGGLNGSIQLAQRHALRHA
jgi:hypothetical protein